MGPASRLTAAGRALTTILLAAFALTGCAQGPQGAAGPDAAPPVVADAEARPLVIFMGNEPDSLGTRSFAAKGRGLYTAWRPFNALAVLIDGRGQPQPELLASLPQLNTDSWQVFPDGTMQTTYTLKPNLTWHDGQPLTAEDFAFSWRVYSTRELGLATQAPMSAMTDVTAIDREHFVIRWKQLYPEANNLSSKNRELPFLPQHVLGPSFDQVMAGNREAFVTHPFWSLQYVGAGPYRLQQWEPGSSIEGLRFEGYALGVSKIPRIQLRFSNDQNVVLSHMLAGEAHMSADNSITQTAAETLAQDWGRTNGGTISSSPSSWRAIYHQLRPDLSNPRAILDPRVRKAIAHAVDRNGINEGIYGGRAIVSDTPIWTGSAWGDVVDSSIPNYPFDLRASENLMNQAGFTKGADGLYRNTEGRPTFEVLTAESSEATREMLAIANDLKAAGFDNQQRLIPNAQALDPEPRATFPTMLIASVSSGEGALSYLATNQIASAANLWQGLNRGGWSNPEYDRLLVSFNNTLDRGQRVQIARQMLRLFAEDAPAVSLLFPSGITAYVSRLQGVTNAAPEAAVSWNIYEWEFK